MWRDFNEPVIPSPPRRLRFGPAGPDYVCGHVEGGLRYSDTPEGEAYHRQVRNVSGKTLEPGAIVAWKEGYERRRVDRVLTDPGKRGVFAGIVDGNIPWPGVPHGKLFWLLVQGGNIPDDWCETLPELGETGRKGSVLWVDHKGEKP
jgi:hypothetical protein